MNPILEPARNDIFAHLKTDILRLQGYRPMKSAILGLNLGPVLNAFPAASFPLGAIHEFISSRQEETASSIGFISGLLSSMVNKSGAVLWISQGRILFPPALKSFGLEPDRFIFIDLKKKKESCLGSGRSAQMQCPVCRGG